MNLFAGRLEYANKMSKREAHVFHMVLLRTIVKSLELIIEIGL